MKQTKFAGFKTNVVYGGELRKRVRTARPIATKKSMHIVLRSSQAVGEWSFKRNFQIVESTLSWAAKKYGVKVYSLAINGNHIHLLVRLTNRFTYRAFIRSFSGVIALKITKSSKLKKLKKRFFDQRPFSRVVEWGKAFTTAMDYVYLNRLEALGIFEHVKGRLKGVSLYPFGRDALIDTA
jgi:REP element-mobilizing transposase RayT